MECREAGDGSLKNCALRISDCGLRIGGDKESVHEINRTLGLYRVEWFRPEKAEAVKGDVVQVPDGSRPFVAPFEGPGVLYLAAALTPK